LIRLDELLGSPDFVADDCCVFGVDILKIDVLSPVKKVIPVQKNATIVQNLFIKNNAFRKATITFNMDNFIANQMKYFVTSSTFIFDGRKWYPSIYATSLLISIIYMHIHIFCFLMNLPLCPRFPFICWS
jgi:hypothetical protein